MKRAFTLLAMALLLGVLSACASSGEPVNNACVALGDVNTAIRATSIVGPASSISDIIAEQNQLSVSWRALVTAVQQLDPSQIPPSLVTANQEFSAVPVATQSTPKLVALTTLSLQANIAQGVVSEFTPVCMSLVTP
mgnify:CR=1 FL=1